MVGFSVIALVIILLTMHHLMHWAWRGIYKETEVNLYGIGCFMTIFLGIFTWALILLIIDWGQPLIK